MSSPHKCERPDHVVLYYETGTVTITDCDEVGGVMWDDTKTQDLERKNVHESHTDSDGNPAPGAINPDPAAVMPAGCYWVNGVLKCSPQTQAAAAVSA